MTAACAWALGTAVSRAQDDNGGAPPPPASPDMSAQAPDDGNGAPDDSVSFQQFYDQLGSQGTWIQSSDYGYVWQPQVTDPDWAPYTEGHWVYSDAGWTWVSDEPWGWATYHYGRWVNLDGTGWVWVPGYTWAPAWVSWRYGDGYAGWAPLPPDSFVGVDYTDDDLSIGIGFHIGGDCDDYYGIGPAYYIFLPVSCLGYHSYHGYYHRRGDNYAIINHTTNVTNLNVTRAGGVTAFGRVTTGGPMLSQVNAVSETPVQRVSLVRTNQPAGGGTLGGNTLALYAPRVNPGTTAQPARVAGSIGPSSINRGTDIMRPLAVNSRLTVTPATEEQVQEARIAQYHAPASAKVLTDPASVTPLLQSPLTAMRPVVSEGTSQHVFSPSPSVEREASSPVVMPSERNYPQSAYPSPQQEESAPSRVYKPSAVYPSQAPSFEPHSAAPYSAPPFYAPAHSYAPAPSYSSAPVVHQSTGGGGGYSGGGGASHAAPSSGSGGGSYHSGGTAGGNSSQSH